MGYIFFNQIMFFMTKNKIFPHNLLISNHLTNLTIKTPQNMSKSAVDQTSFQIVLSHSSIKATLLSKTYHKFNFYARLFLSLLLEDGEINLLCD